MAVEENFDRKYTTSNPFIKLLVKRFFKCIEEMLSEIEFKRVLETGCGPGFSTQYLKKFLRDKDFEASDLKENLVKEARKRNSEVRISQESIYDLKREDNSFDLIIALEVLEHLEEPEAALKELYRVTSRFCLLSIPNEPLWRILNMCRLAYLKDFGNTPGHIQHWSKRQFANFLQNYFKINKITMSLPWIIALVEKK
ncbi:MAG: class I SAM-dependent methyltransferase [Candidatus Paceibacterales bacterium]